MLIPHIRYFPVLYLFIAIHYIIYCNKLQQILGQIYPRSNVNMQAKLLQRHELSHKHFLKR